MEILNLLNSSLHEDYNNIPVLYCKHCLSLLIKDMEGIGYCEKCGGTDIEETHIEEWEKLYEYKYGKKHLNK